MRKSTETKLRRTVLGSCTVLMHWSNCMGRRLCINCSLLRSLRGRRAVSAVRDSERRQDAVACETNSRSSVATKGAR